MFRPIPKKILIHECILKPFLGRDDWGSGDMFGADILLKNVRIEYNKSYRVSANAEDNLYKSILFIDYVNSKPRIEVEKGTNKLFIFPFEGSFQMGNEKIELRTKSKIIFNGQEMTIESLSPVYAKGLHHYELGLV